jgi:uncharacterized membrane protein YfcA
LVPEALAKPPRALAERLGVLFVDLDAEFAASSGDISLYLDKHGAIQLGMAGALLSAALFMTMGLLRLYPTGGLALTLPFGRFVLACVANFVFGTIAMLGIGSYGPSLVLFSLLGMDPRAAFPIMMGSGAFVGVVAGMRFVRSGRYVAPAALGLTLGGIPGVLIAVWLVKSLPLDVVRWGVIAVVLYTP